MPRRAEHQRTIARLALRNSIVSICTNIYIYICLYIHIYIYTVYFLYTYVYQMAGDTPIFQTNPRWGRVASELHRIGKHMGTEAAKCGVFPNMAMDQKWCTNGCTASIMLPG